MKDDECWQWRTLEMPRSRDTSLEFGVNWDKTQSVQCYLGTGQWGHVTWLVGCSACPMYIKTVYLCWLHSASSNTLWSLGVRCSMTLWWRERVFSQLISQRIGTIILRKLLHSASVATAASCLKCLFALSILPVVGSSCVIFDCPK